MKLPCSKNTGTTNDEKQMQQISTTIPTTARAYARDYDNDYDYDMQGSNMTLMIQVRLKDQPGAGEASEH